ncbi:MAG: hypothetical protein KBI42_05995 [Bacteroidia bacterium]|nr:hypothetical protein [Bacteroidia bacterium]MBP8668315.1 hypothetical protein [Bacteroidia bacterium]HQX70728.1 hypothetical protein [Bacteroidia bacterium]
MKFIKYLFCCLIIVHITIAKAEDSIANKKIVLKIAPINFVDQISHQSAMIGTEYWLGTRYGFEISFAPIFGRDYFNGYGGTGFKSSVEVKRCFSMKGKRLFYLGTKLFYNKINYASKNLFENKITSEEYEEKYFIRKSVYGANITSEVEWRLFPKIILNINAGIGLRVKNVRHYQRLRPEDNFYSVDVLAENVRDKKGNYVLPDMAIGIKIGYVIDRIKKVQDN